MLELTAEHLDALHKGYATPPRAYHSWDHIEEMRTHFATTEFQRPDEVMAALLYHDFVYVAGRADNEQLSAEAAVDACRRHWPQLDAAWVQKLILLTASHGKIAREALSEDERRFLDCDMAILASDWARFERYDSEIAEEYVRVPRLLYKNGRKRFLKKLLEAERIYLSDQFHERLDARARANLQRLLDA